MFSQNKEGQREGKDAETGECPTYPLGFWGMRSYCKICGHRQFKVSHVIPFVMSYESLVTGDFGLPGWLGLERAEFIFLFILYSL